MQGATRVRATAGLAGLISGVMLMEATGLTLVLGWALVGIALTALFAAAPPPARRVRRLRAGARRPSPSATARS
jgi:hypothetical protein